MKRMSLNEICNLTVGGPSDEVLAVARYIRHLDPNAHRMKLEKLLYYVQGWSLAWTGKPLFPEVAQAYKYGPVYGEVYGEDKYQNGAGITSADLTLLTDSDRELIRAVVDQYRSVSGWAMGRLTHEEKPWREARGDLPPEAPSKAAISHRSMMQHFSSVPEKDEPRMQGTTTCTWERPTDSFMAEEKSHWSRLLELLGA